LPQGKCYLAATVSDLRKIIDNHGGDADANPVVLCEDKIVWYNPDKVSGTCKCTSRGPRHHSDFSQVPMPTSWFREEAWKRNFPPFDLYDLADDAAVVFGHNKNLPYQVPDTGDPKTSKEWARNSDSSEEEQHNRRPFLSLPPALSKSSYSSFQDSGVGNSSGTMALALEKDDSSDSTTEERPQIKGSL
jgi:hypothetical protein